MPATWTPDQVLSLAPDDTSRKNASGLATPRRWSSLCKFVAENQHVLWGEIHGSGADPYRCQVDLDGPGYKCSCPSRKLPCKHTLALFLLFAGQPNAFEVSAPPDWVTLWLVKRAEQNELRAQRAAARAEGRGPAPDPQAAEQARNRRAAERDRRIRAGLDDLETWLCDLLRQGLASAQSQPRAFWETASARLVDAQAPGLARLVRALPGIASSGASWQERLLDQVARLYLAIEGYRRIESLPPDHQADLRAVIGFTLKQEDLLENPGVADTWLILGSQVEEETGLAVQRTWLVGQSSGQPALVLTFAATGGAAANGGANGGPLSSSGPSPTMLDSSLAPGLALPAELVFYPGAYPLRAAVRTRQPAQDLPAGLPGCSSLVEATAGYAAALARFPWLERYPLALNGVRPLYENGEWSVCDSAGRCAPLTRGFLHGWTLLALSGGRPLGLFGEWNGERLLPLSAWSEGRFLPL
jgi:hypothetical protein